MAYLNALLSPGSFVLDPHTNIGFPKMLIRVENAI
jgi:hypothetical protein